VLSWGRFDDVKAEVGQQCSAAYCVLSAYEPSEVVPVLAEVGRATEQGCWAFGYVAYEAASGLDPSLQVADRPYAGLPLVWFGLCEEPARVPIVAPPCRRNYAVTGWHPMWTLEGYQQAVARVHEHIAAGDTYQCNLTVRLRSKITGDLEQLYADLAVRQRASHCAYLDLGRYVVASASPELFLEWTGDQLLTRPMKGTAPRGRWTAEDDEKARRLVGSAKERAENLMIVDLLRNDLSRVAEVGSVAVPALFSLERYETVWQLTSDVTATLRAGVGLVDVFRALFPCGSVTGAPKQRTMQLIQDLEDGPRGVYCGAIGLVAPPNAPYRARFSVAIRTVVIDRATGDAVYGTGGGITWESVPEAEHAELLTKAAILSAPCEDFALLETMAHIPGAGLRNLDRHLRRLEGSARYFGFPFDPEQARTELAAAVSGAGQARVRLLLSRPGALNIELSPAPQSSRRPVTLTADLDPVDSAQRWLYHKTTHRELYDQRAARHQNSDDVVLINERGQITETTIANIAVRVNKRWWTPPVDVGCLPGVERGRLLELGLLGERTLTLDDLRRAEALAVISSLRGWQPALLIDAG
jgi:para-aminobenzoate synthetase / 4-amino-4-deoxychorismate lyase